MNEPLVHLTLRELHRLARHRRGWAVLVVFGIGVGLVGPFGTFDLMVGVRIAYWLAVVVGTAIVGTAGIAFLEIVLERLVPSWPRLVRALVAGVLTGPAVMLAVVVVNVAAFGRPPQTLGLPDLLVYCCLITGAVALIAGLFEPPARGGPELREAPSAPIPPPILERLAHGKRGALLRLSVSDHYVEVETDRGVSLVLMRLSDAMRETGSVAGIQVHRSHWVALAAVKAGRRKGGAAELELVSGRIVPVSRSQLAAVRAAGLIG